MTTRLAATPQSHRHTHEHDHKHTTAVAINLNRNQHKPSQATSVSSPPRLSQVQALRTADESELRSIFLLREYLEAVAGLHEEV